MTQYRCVPGPIVSNIRNSTNRDNFYAEIQGIINSETADGWNFVSLHQFETIEKSGCWPFATEGRVTSTMLLFWHQ